MQELFLPGNTFRIVGSVSEFNGTYQVSGIEYNMRNPNDPNSCKLLQEGDGVANAETTATTFYSKVSVESENEDGEIVERKELSFLKRETIDEKIRLIIIDEAHRLSNNDSIRYKIIKDLIKRGTPDSIYLATGTPITNNPQNFYCVLKLINDPITDDWQYYMDRYCGAMKIPAKGEKEKYTNFYLKRKNKTSWYDLTQAEKDELKQYIRENARHITIAKDGTNKWEKIKEFDDRINALAERTDLTESEKYADTDLLLYQN